MAQLRVPCSPTAPPSSRALPSAPRPIRVGETAWGIQFHAEVTGADAAKWTRDYAVDEDAVRIGIDPEALGAETEAKIGAWNGLGRELCARWLAAATA